MKNKLFSFILVFLVGIVSVNAQKVQVKKGDFDALKGQTELNVEFKYETSVGKFDKEADYLAEKVAEKNEDEAGAGDAWKAKWLADRTERFEPKFFELFNAYKKKTGLEANDYGNAKYTLVFNTTHTEAGWNVGVMRKSAHINAELTLVETANPDKVLGQAIMEKVPGRDAFGYDFDSGYRLQEAYALTAKVFAKYLEKKVMK